MIPKEVAELNRQRIPKEKINEVLEKYSQDNEMHGVEALYKGFNWEDRYWGDIVCLYVNSGDCYVPSLFYSVRRKRFYFGDIEKIIHVCGDNLRTR